MRWSSVEWGAGVARVYPALMAAAVGVPSASPPLRVVLPDLPRALLAPAVRSAFAERVPAALRTHTIAAHRHSSEQALLEYCVDQNLLCADASTTNLHHPTILVVGGNHNDDPTEINSSSSSRGGLSSVQVIRALAKWRRASDSALGASAIWAVANPNADDSDGSVEAVRAKCDAGATGFITQPLLSYRAVATLQRYPASSSSTAAAAAASVDYVAGLALPATAAGLQFWWRLVGKNGIDGNDDPLFRDHVRYFSNKNRDRDRNSNSTSAQWALDQVRMLSAIDCLSGIHYMPLGNTRDLLTVLQAQQHVDER